MGYKNEAFGRGAADLVFATAFMRRHGVDSSIVDLAIPQTAGPHIVSAVVRSLARMALVGVVAGALAGPAWAESLLLIDAGTGKVLQAENATYPWHPASLSKLMTTYVVLQAVKDGRITFDTLLTVSPNAVAQSPSKMGFRAGVQVTVDNALKMMLVHSANDIAVVLAEGVSGSVEKFADEMNATSQRLGMTQSSWVNPNGLPDDRQITSARDLGILARALMHDFPQYDFYWHIPAIKFGRRVIRNYNKLLLEYPGADGMKTGFICAAGYNLIASATRGDRRLIAIVLGAPSGAARTAKAASMLEQGFNTGGGLSWLLPSLGTVDALQPINAAPPDLHDQICGPHRKRPASESDDEEAANGGEADSQRAFMLSDLKGATHGSLLTGNPLADVPPVVVFTGAKRPTGNGEAEADAATLKSAKKHTKHGAKAGTKAAKAKGDKPEKADKSPKAPKTPKTGQSKTGQSKTGQTATAQAKTTPKSKAAPATP
jgi:D-alanyl-D-alanine carboxypeptidase